MKRATRVSGLLALVLVAVLGIAVPAHATTQAKPAPADVAATTLSKLQNSHTLRCPENSFGGGLKTDTCIVHNAQLWWMDLVPSTTRIKNYHTQKCLQDSFAGRLEVADCINHNAQLWYTYYVGSYKWRIQNVHTLRYLQDSFAGGLQALDYEDHDAQRWYIYQ